MERLEIMSYFASRKASLDSRSRSVSSPCLMQLYGEPVETNDGESMLKCQGRNAVAKYQEAYECCRPL